LRRRKHCRVGPDSREYRNIFNSAPEILGRISSVPCRSDINAAGNGHIVRDSAETVDSGVKSNLNICAVGAGFEEECVTLLAELVRLLGCEDRIDLSLDRAGVHGGIEDQDVGTKVEGTGIGWECRPWVGDLSGDGNGGDCCRHCLNLALMEKMMALRSEVTGFFCRAPLSFL